MISSLKNQKVKELIKLREGKHRRRQKRFIIEGEREFTRALRYNIEIREAFVFEAALSPTLKARLKTSGFPIIPVSQEVFQKMALREGSGGICAVGTCRYQSLDDLPQDEQNALLLLATEGVEKPGNLGAILRTADGAGVSAVVVLDQVVDIYNPNCIRASLGAAFSVPVIHCTGLEFRNYCRQHKIRIAAASPFAKDYYFEHDNVLEPIAIILGAESKGLSELWDQERLIKIPMAGVGDSLNVSVAAAILLYDIVRQRLQVSP